MNQRQVVVNELLKKGRITRNFCLRSYISRLGAIIWKLKKDGWEFDSRYVKTNGFFGEKTDYEYRVIQKGDK